MATTTSKAGKLTFKVGEFYRVKKRRKVKALFAPVKDAVPKPLSPRHVLECRYLIQEKAYFDVWEKTDEPKVVFRINGDDGRKVTTSLDLSQFVFFEQTEVELIWEDL